jgi:hypothetical protein
MNSEQNIQKTKRKQGKPEKKKEKKKGENITISRAPRCVRDQEVLGVEPTREKEKEKKEKNSRIV